MDWMVVLFSFVAFLQSEYGLASASSLRFEKESYSTCISMHMAEDSIVFHGASVKSTNDEKISYSMKAKDDFMDEFFRVDQSSGMIFLTKTLPEDLHEKLHLIIVATNDAGFYALADLFVSLHKKNAPKFDHKDLEISVNQNTNVGNILTRDLHAVDPNGGKVVYSIQHMDPATDGTFHIDDTSGVLWLKRPLDYQFRGLYQVKVIATDCEGLTGHMDVFITVERPMVTNLPFFGSQVYSVNLNETSPPGEVVFRDIHAYNPSGGKLRYILRFPAACTKGTFRIDAETGVVWQADHLDAKLHPFYVLEVIAKSDFMSASATLIVTVLEVEDGYEEELIDEHQGPRFQNSSYSVIIDQDTRLYTVVYTGIKATDPDGGKVHYSIVDDKMESRPTFSICNQTGHVTLLRPLDVNYRSFYKLKIKAVDCQQFSAFAFLSIWITRNGSTIPDNEIIQFQSFPGNASVNQNHMNETLIFTVKATSIFNDVVHYELLDTLNGSITINPDTGEITTSKLLLWTPTGDYVIRVKAKDSNGAEKVNSFTLVIDEPDLANSPQFSPFPDITIPMLTANGSVVATLNATNNYPGGYVHYSIFIDLGDGDFVLSEVFHIDHNTSTVIIRDKPRNPDYDLIVIAYNDKGFITNQELLIQVDFVGAPTFTNTDDADIFLADNTPAQFVTNVAAVDPDGSVVTYTILDLNTGLFTDVPFTIDVNGDMTTSMELTPGTEFRLMVEAVDAEGKWAIKIITVTVPGTATNLIAPTFSKTTYSIDVAETQTLHTIFTYITAEDTDTFAPNNILSYFLQTSADPIFGINVINGGLYFKQVPSPGIYSLTVSARDQGTPSMEVFVTFDITITATIINHMPVFTSSNVLTSRTGDLTLGTDVGTIIVTDDSDPGSIITYSINDRVTADTYLFSIGSLTGILTTIKVLTARTAAYLITVTATDNGSPSFSIHLDLQIFVFSRSQINPPPQFSGPFAFSIVEDAYSQGSAVVTDVQVTDDNLPVSISITSGDTDNLFSFTGTRLNVVGDVDREIINSFTLMLLAVDSGSPPASSTATLTINIIDVNDNSPVFDSTSYTFTTYDDLTIASGSLIGSLLATDGDIAGPNSQIVYLLEFSADSSMFTIDPNIAEIYAILPLQGNTNYSLTVTAQDGGSPPMSATVGVTVVILLRTNPGPQFSGSFDFSITEGVYSTNSVSVVSIVATAAFLPIQYSIMSGNAMGNFLITGNSLMVVDDLDRETTSTYLLAVRAVDSANPPASSTATFTISVTDINDNAPEFNQSAYSYSIFTDTSGVIGQLSASDADDGNNALLGFSLVNSPSYFTVDPTSGAITASQPIPANSYVFATEVTDNYGMVSSTALTARADITVAVVEHNRPPVFAVQNDISVREDAYTGTDIPIGVVAATDPDVGAFITYSLSATTTFRIDATSGTLFVTAPLDRETMAQYIFPVFAVDNGTPPATGTVTMTVNILDVNDNSPTFNQTDYTFLIQDTNPLNVPFASVLAEDPDDALNGMVLYQLTHGFFGINPTNGALSLTSPVTPQTFDFSVTASDTGSPARTTSVNVQVIVTSASNPIHEFTGPMSFTVNENTASETLIANIATNRPDSTTISFSLIGTSIFRIDNLGDIFVTGLLDREVSERTTFTVIVIDSAPPPVTVSATVTINIADLNDNSPKFNQTEYDFQILDTVTINDVIGSVFATDIDQNANGIVSYSMTPTSPYFGINSQNGAITVIAQPLVHIFDLTVKASDGGNPSLSSTVDVAIVVTSLTPINVGPTFSGSMSFSVDENTANNFEIGTISVSDPHQPVTCSQIGSSSFTVSSSCTISVAGALDRETRDTHSVVVVAVDSGSPIASSTGTVGIQVLDMNDNDPVFDSFSSPISISSATASGTLIAVLGAQDADIGFNGNIVYDNFNGLDGFDVNSDNGQIKWTGNVLAGTYVLQVRASDQGTPARTAFASLTINVVTGIVNSPPAFDFSNYNAVIREDSSINDVVTTMNAEGASLTYSITSGNALGHFDIRADTGEVIVIALLDYETTPTYTLGIRATGDAGVMANTLLKITLTNINENKPIFNQTSYSASITSDTEVGEEILRVLATDADGDNVSYFPNGNGINFDVDDVTGAVTLVMDNLAIGTYVFSIFAIDDGKSAQYSVVTVKITVTS